MSTNHSWRHLLMFAVAAGTAMTVVGPAAAETIIPIPYSPLNPSLPHPAHGNAPITLKAIMRGAVCATGYDYWWDVNRDNNFDNDTSGLHRGPGGGHRLRSRADLHGARAGGRHALPDQHPGPLPVRRQRRVLLDLQALRLRLQPRRPGHLDVRHGHDHGGDEHPGEPVVPPSQRECSGQLQPGDLHGPRQ